MHSRCSLIFLHNTVTAFCKKSGQRTRYARKSKPPSIRVMQKVLSLMGYAVFIEGIHFNPVFCSKLHLFNLCKLLLKWLKCWNMKYMQSYVLTSHFVTWMERLTSEVILLKCCSRLATIPKQVFYELYNIYGPKCISKPNQHYDELNLSKPEKMSFKVVLNAVVGLLQSQSRYLMNCIIYMDLRKCISVL